MPIDVDSATPTDGLDQFSMPSSLQLELYVRDPECIAELIQHEEGHLREEFALRALRIGILAIRQSRGLIDGATIRRETERLLDTLHHSLADHANHVQKHVSTMLKDYFDPQSGRLEERLHRLIKQDGELETLLRRQIGEKDSELYRTLSGTVGEGSWLMKTLDPNQADGLLATLRQCVMQQLEEQREQVVKQFSLDDEQSALSRLVRELTRNHGELSSQLHAKISEVVKEFSLDEEDSSLSRLVRNVERAQRTITSEFSLDHDESALARLRRELLRVMKDQQDEQRKFQEEVKTSLHSMAARREESQKSTRHGIAFEEAVFQFVQHDAQSHGDVATSTGANVGMIKNCKIGDAVVELGPDKSAAGARIVIEAKEKQAVSLRDAQEELEQACKNRQAGVGLFVFSHRIAPAGLEPLQRIGSQIFVVWDAEDATTDVYFSAGLALARALCFQHHCERTATQADFSAMEGAMLEIEKRTAMLESVEKSAKTIKNASEKILKNAGRIRSSLDRQVAKLRQQMCHLRDGVEQEWPTVRYS